MKYYFSLQFKRTWRILHESGIHPAVGFALILLAFLIFSHLFFLKVTYAEYLYLFIALFSVNAIRNNERNKFLKLSFSHRDYILITIIENFAIVFPFALFLLFKHSYTSFVLLNVIALIPISSSFNLDVLANKAIPTPFYKYPFEFLVGFRKNYLLIILIYGLGGIAAYHSNFNLGMFSFILPFLLISFSFYSTNEAQFFVWVHSSTASKFLFGKIATGILYSFLLALPLGLMILFLNIDKWMILVLVELLGLLFVVTSILGKYAYYPSSINIIQGFSIGFSMIFPPFLLALIPFLFIKAKQNLSFLLP